MNHTLTQIFKKLAAPAAGRHYGRCYVYGAGRCGRMVAERLTRSGTEVVGLIDRAPAEREVCGFPVFSLSYPALDDTLPVVVGVYNPSSDSDHYAIAKSLNQCGFHVIVPFLKFYADYAGDIGNYVNLVPGSFYLEYQDEIMAAAELWADAKSKKLYLQRIAALSLGELPEDNPVESECQYFPEDVPFWNKPLSFVDLGACDGDTIFDFHERKIRLNKVWAFEPDPENYRRLAQRIRDFDRAETALTVLPLSVCDRSGITTLCASGDASSHIGEGGTPVMSCRLDDVLAGESPDYIKLDKGCEEAALNGMHDLLMRCHPMLAVCVYHKPEDLFRIPLLLKRWKYPAAFYLRQHGGNFFDTVCYAIPASWEPDEKKTTR